MILGKLKEATKQQHEGLENTVNVMGSLFSLDDYKTMMTKFYRFYSSIEPRLGELDWAEVGHNFDERLKVPKLKKDLVNLGFSEDEISEIPVWDGLPKLDSHAKAFGSLYVMEGATLGGQIINRHLKEHLNLTTENGGLFFGGYGKETGPMWKKFGETVTAFSESNNEDEQIVETAKQTFDSFKACFEATD